MYTFNLGIRFEAVAHSYAQNPALKFAGGHTVSYEQLNQCANQLARYLLDLGVRSKDVVCLSGDKHLHTYAGLLACLKIGAIYTMADPDSPLDRLERIFATCQPKVLLVGAKLAEQLGGRNGHTVVRSDTADFAGKLASYDRYNLGITPEVTGDHPAYIMYTSGSTGVPKGAVMTHDNLLRFIDWSTEAFDITPNDCLTNVNPLYFDNSVFDIYSALFAGAALAPFSKADVAQAPGLVAAVAERACTLWFSVPSLLIFLQTLKALHPSDFGTLRRIVFGGEGYPKAKLKQLYDLYAPRTTFFNVYGPTECTCICSSYRIADDDFTDLQGYPPLGGMIRNFSYLILDEKERPVLDGEVGELCLLGPNVGKGYYNDPERTRLGFCQNPIQRRYEERMYRTGDLVRYNPRDGKIYILGRQDNQIKHMGYRIELEEIETAISRLDYIREVAVVHGTRQGLSQIIAVVSVQDGKAGNDIRDDLKRMLPAYMIPTSFHLVTELRKNPNGKVDRKGLAETYAV